MSLVGHANAEWRTRKINMIQFIRSFISQLRPGQELTKVSLPSVVCLPFSMLEVIAHREIVMFHELFGISQIEDPLQRFLNVVRFYFTVIRNETLEKKPYNPVIGEQHFCWVPHDDEDAENVTEFISEQVSHHPPISAFVLRNIKHNLMFSGNIIFKVSFGSNCVNITTSGGGFLDIGSETYEFTKCLPDMIIRNVVWGKKYIMWIGKITIRCPETGYFAELEMAEKNSKTNSIKGCVKNADDEIIYNIKGKASDLIYYSSPDDDDEKTCLLDFSDTVEGEVQYPKESQWHELNSLNVWREVNEAIIRNDMRTADNEKQKIEQNQRERIKERKENDVDDQSEYFEYNEERGIWTFKNNFSVNVFINE